METEKLAKVIFDWFNARKIESDVCDGHYIRSPNGYDDCYIYRADPETLVIGADGEFECRKLAEALSKELK